MMMDDYISREAALKKQTIITERYHAQGADEEYVHKVVRSEDIRAIPAADVAPVVRCKDCVYRIDGRCYNPKLQLSQDWRSDAWFCADGTKEKKDEQR